MAEQSQHVGCEAERRGEGGFLEERFEPTCRTTGQANPGICKQGLQGRLNDPAERGVSVEGGTKEARTEQGQGRSSALAVLLLCLGEGLGKAGLRQPGPHHLVEAGEERARERGQAACRSGWRSDSQ